MEMLKRFCPGVVVTWLVIGLATSAAAQTDLAGSWASLNHEDALERGAGPYQVDYTGIPLNDEGRAMALSYSASEKSRLERQCAFWPPHYIAMGPFPLRIWPELDPVNGKTIAWVIGPFEDRGTTRIWMDGRPHPSELERHTQGGFTTGTWEGNTLVTTTTHIKAGAIRRNGAPSSDRETLTMRLMRHGDLLTVLTIIEDPVYLTEPFMVSKTFRLSLDAPPAYPTGPPCTPAFEGRDDANVPHILPGKNTAIDELMRLYHIPVAAALGGAPTMYPEYRKTLKDTYTRPEKCPANCGIATPGSGVGTVTPGRTAPDVPAPPPGR
jgi:hypothetical protein